MAIAYLPYIIGSTDKKDHLLKNKKRIKTIHKTTAVFPKFKIHDEELQVQAYNLQLEIRVKLLEFLHFTVLALICVLFMLKGS